MLKLQTTLYSDGLIICVIYLSIRKIMILFFLSFHSKVLISEVKSVKAEIIVIILYKDV
jgi:hypothetical protein